MSTWVTHRFALAGSAVMAAALIAGCGGGSSSPAARTHPAPTHAPSKPAAAGSTAKVVLASVRTTAAAKSARVSVSLSASGPGADAVSLTGDGVINFVNGDSQFALHVGGAAAAVLPDGIEERQVGGVVYVKVALVGGSDNWVALDVGNLSAASSLVPGLQNTDPRQFLGALEGISDNVTKVGTQSVRGVETTHYHAAIDFGKALDQADIPPPLRDAEKQFEKSNDAGASTIPVDVFVDSDGYVRRISLELEDVLGDDVGRGAAAGPALTVSVDLYDFGTPANVQPPPPDQVSHEPLLGGLGDLGGSGSTAPPAGRVSSAV